MNYSIFSSQLVTVYLISTSLAFAQSPPEEVVVLSPNEYTAMMLGDTKIENPSGIYRLELEETAQGRQSLSTEVSPFNDPENMVEVSLAPHEQFAVTYLLFIKRLAADIENLGTQNSIRLYANGYDISQESARNVVNSIMDISSVHNSMLAEIKKQNCLDFNDSFGSGAGEKALSQFNRNEKNVNQASLEYFGRVDEDLARLIPGNVYEHFQSVISQMSGGVKSLQIEKTNASNDPVNDILLRCEARLR